MPAKKYKKGKKVVGTAAPGKPYYSSKELGEGFEQTLPASVSSEQFRQGPMGSASPRALIQDATTHGMDLFRDKEGKRGSRLSRKAAKKMVKPKKQTKKTKKKKAPEAKSQSSTLPFFKGSGFRDFDSEQSFEHPLRGRGFAPFDKKKKAPKKTKKMNAGGKVGRGYGKARGAKACKYVSMKGA